METTLKVGLENCGNMACVCSVTRQHYICPLESRGGDVGISPCPQLLACLHFV
jgi:hypothetical protein